MSGPAAERNANLEHDVMTAVCLFARDELIKVLPDEVSLQTTLDELGIDSLEAVELILFLEDEFDIAIDECEELYTDATIGEIVSLVRNALSVR